jgi:hypothetical protein
LKPQKTITTIKTGRGQVIEAQKEKIKERGNQQLLSKKKKKINKDPKPTPPSLTKKKKKKTIDIYFNLLFMKIS